MHFGIPASSSSHTQKHTDTTILSLSQWIRKMSILRTAKCNRDSRCAVFFFFYFFCLCCSASFSVSVNMNIDKANATTCKINHTFSQIRSPILNRTQNKLCRLLDEFLFSSNMQLQYFMRNRFRSQIGLTKVSEEEEEK